MLLAAYFFCYYFRVLPNFHLKYVYTIDAAAADDNEFNDDDDDEFDDDALLASMLPVSLESGRLLPEDVDGSDEKGLTC